MKGFISEFFRRGLTACGLGPMVLAIFYLVFRRQHGLETLMVEEVCLGIFSLSALAFVAGGMNTLYQIERLPLMAAIFLHGTVLYLAYLATYLINGWLVWGAAAIGVFSCIFLGGYFAIWAVIYLILRRRTAKLNEKLQQKQQAADPGA